MHRVGISACCCTLCLWVGCSDPPTPTAPVRTPVKAVLADRSKPVRAPVEAPLPNSESMVRTYADLYSWFDTLGFPDLSKLPFGRVTYAQPGQSAEAEQAENMMHGFLLEDDGHEFSLLTPNLITHTLARATVTLRRTGGSLRFMTLDLEQAATAKLAQLREPYEEVDRIWFFGHGFSEGLRVFVMARACAATGLAELADELVQQSAVVRGGPGNEAARIDVIAAALSADIADSMMGSHMDALGEPSVGRPELLRRFRHLVTTFPQSQHAGQARQYAELLQRMVAEDTQHAAKQRKPLEEMTTHERVAELIHQLRDQNGGQYTRPGSCDIFADPRDGGAFGDQSREGGSPASQLVAIGFEAVPQLIDHLGDRRLTRSLGMGRTHTSQYALRIGDCARAIIARIAGRRLPARADPLVEIQDDAEADQVRNSVEKWWKSLEKQGERQLLIEGTMSGSMSAPEQARRLLQKHPNVAKGSIFHGAMRAVDTGTRYTLLEMLERLDREAYLTFLNTDMKNGVSLSLRVYAGARLLREDEDADVMPAMIAEWESLRGKKLSGSWGLLSTDAFETLVAVLADSRQLAAVQALAKDWHQQPVDRRLTIVSAFGTTHGSGRGQSSSGGTGLLFSSGWEPASDEITATVEELLINALDDMQERRGIRMQFGSTSLDDPRICDVAGLILADRWPNRYQFDFEAAQPVRNRQRITLKNAWRRSRGLALLPIPAARPRARIQAERVDPLLDALIANSADEATAAEVESLGLPALTNVLERLDALSENHAAQTGLQLLARRLSCIVNKISFTRSSALPDTDLEEQLRALRGKPLTSEALVELLVAVGRQCPQGASGIELSADRHDARHGVELQITLTTDFTPRTGVYGSWDIKRRVDAGKEMLLSSHGGMNVERATEHRVHSDLAKAVDKALESDLPFRIRVSQILQGDPPRSLSFPQN